MGAERSHILVLNYNGKGLLGQCLPSVVEAAAHAPEPCAVSIVDNGSTDGSPEALAAHWPEIPVWREPNRGLASFNAVMARLDEPVVLLLNNDLKLHRDAVGPLVKAVSTHDDALFAAPLCWDFEGEVYEGMRTRVRTRFGLIQGMCRVPGHESAIGEPDLTASAGPVLAVDRRKFLALGGYDPIYFPGRIEDLDLGFRGWMAGLRGYYVPQAIAYHKGFGSFGPEFGTAGNDRLAARNSLIFAWKNLGGRRLASHLGWLPARLLRSLLSGDRTFASAFMEALERLEAVRMSRRRLAVGQGSWVARQEAFFERFRW